MLLTYLLTYLQSIQISMIVFVGCPEGCRYHTASAVYDLVQKILSCQSVNRIENSHWLHSRGWGRYNWGKWLRGWGWRRWVAIERGGCVGKLRGGDWERWVRGGIWIVVKGDDWRAVVERDGCIRSSWWRLLMGVIYFGSGDSCSSVRDPVIVICKHVIFGIRYNDIVFSIIPLPS